MRILLAGLAGGVVLFIWGAFTHMALPTGHAGVSGIPNDDALVPAIRRDLTENVVYFFPGFDMNREMTAEEQAAWEAKYKAGPAGIIVVRPTGGNVMGPGTLLTELGANIIAAIAVALILSWLLCGFSGRVIAAGLVGLAAWLAVDVSLWNWYGFPTAYTLSSALDQVVGWLLAGVAMAFVLKPRAQAE